MALAAGPSARNLHAEALCHKERVVGLDTQLLAELGNQLGACREYISEWIVSVDHRLLGQGKNNHREVRGVGIYAKQEEWCKNRAQDCAPGRLRHRISTVGPRLWRAQSPCVKTRGACQVWSAASFATRGPLIQLVWLCHLGFH